MLSNWFLKKKESYLHILPENNPEPVLIFSITGEIVYQNDSSKERLPNLTHLSDLTECSGADFINNKDYLKITYLKDAQDYAFNIKGVKEDNCIIAFGFNITQLERAKGELNHSLMTDSLTNLGNRQKLYKDIRSNKEYIILITLNIVNFGEFNSFYGHKIGDEFLKAYARLLEKSLKIVNEDSMAYRLNGNTFAMLITFPQANPDFLKNIELILNEVHHALTRYQFNIANIETNFNARFGISVDKQNKDNAENYAENLINDAETALQEAKNRNVSILYYKDIPNIKEKYETNLVWSQKLRNILIHKHKEPQLISYFQPIYNLKTNEIDKYEALVRIKDGDKLHSPIEFLKAAEQLNLLSKITRIVLVSLLEKLQNTNFLGSINLSNQDLCDPLLMDFFKEQCQLYKIEPSRISLEILEDELMYESLPIIQKWKKAGYKIAIDDFGAGYSNFKKLQVINADYIKIDGSLIKNIVHEEQDVKIVYSIESYAKAIDAEVIAEFVSEKAILDKLKDMNIDYAQGYYVGKPNVNLEVVRG